MTQRNNEQRKYLRKYFKKFDNVMIIHNRATTKAASNVHIVKKR
jgi:hypothetical protein